MKFDLTQEAPMQNSELLDIVDVALQSITEGISLLRNILDVIAYTVDNPCETEGLLIFNAQAYLLAQSRLYITLVIIAEFAPILDIIESIRFETLLAEGEAILESSLLVNSLNICDPVDYELICFVVDQLVDIISMMIRIRNALLNLRKTLTAKGEV